MSQRQSGRERKPQSARTLFRATGNKAKSKVIRTLDGEYERVESVPRAEDDFMPTPQEPTLALMHYERDALSRYPLIWEAACGDGRMQRDIESCGYKTIGSRRIEKCGSAGKHYVAGEPAVFGGVQP